MSEALTSSRRLTQTCRVELDTGGLRRRALPAQRLGGVGAECLVWGRSALCGGGVPCVGVECLVWGWSALCGGGVPCVGAECLVLGRSALCWGGVPCVGVECLVLGWSALCGGGVPCVGAECLVLGRSVGVECLVQSKGMHSLGQHLGLPEEQQAGPTLI